MGDYEKSTTVNVEPQLLFSYLGDVQNLPRFLPQLTSVEPAGDDRVRVTAHLNPPDGPERDVEGEAWVSVKQEGRTLAWGAPGPNDYRGELDVDPGDAEGTSHLTVRLHTERTAGPSIDSRLEETLVGIKTAAEESAAG
ncbi:SRPBCC family protein [Lapillicoccus sp.]|uniref:SRPBCC family protein n=1 Tax=Lapillicoccus sp. TaxID=1909287 RepID=UPI0039838C03